MSAGLIVENIASTSTAPRLLLGPATALAAGPTAVFARRPTASEPVG